MNNSKLDYIIKQVEGAATKISPHELLSDIFETGAIAVSNRFDTSKAAKLREEKYRQIMTKYSPESQKQICDIFAEILILLTNQTKDGFYDYLGELYMVSNTGNKKVGQFFTPYHVSELNAAANLEDTIEKTAEENTAIEITLRSRIKGLEVDLENHKDANPKVLEMMTTEMKKLRVKLEKEKERVKKLKESADAEKEKAAAEARAAAEDEARKKFEQETKSLRENNQEAAAEIDRLTRKLANSSNSEMASFKAYADQLQKAFGACVTSIGKVETEDQQQAAKMRDALRRVMENLAETI